AHIGLLRVGIEALEDAQPRAVLADQRGSLVREHLLIGAGLEELPHPQAAGVARGLPGRKRVVGSDHLVAIGDVGAGTEKQRAVVLHVVQEVVRISRHHLHMLEATRSASRTISSSLSQRMTSPKSAHALPAASAVGSIASRRSTSRIVSRASFSELVMR